MTLRTMLKKQGTVRGRRWIIKRHSDETIREVKLIFNPKEYELMERARPMMGDRLLLMELEKNYENRKNV
jgi:hypothetical protein